MSNPNIILILADDMGFADIGCMGSEIRTPNIDAMAASGATLTSMYNCARCCPTRASLLTGLYPHKAGIGHMGLDFGTAAYQGYLRNDSATIAEVLKAAGYRTMMSGKWHVGSEFDAREVDNWRGPVIWSIRRRASAVLSASTVSLTALAVSSHRISSCTTMIAPRLPQATFI